MRYAFPGRGWHSGYPVPILPLGVFDTANPLFKCPACIGTGRVGGAKCTECRGKGTTPFAPRVRFNWGYHDAARDTRKGIARDVSGHYDDAYKAGYIYGLRDATNGTYAGDSDAAWTQYAPPVYIA